jgi:hypothetical protein
MSVFSRVLLAGVVCASLAIVQAAPTVARAQPAATGDGQSSDTRGRFLHASKCVMLLGFGAGCDKDAPAPKAADRAAVVKAPVDTGTRSQFFHASKCVMSLGFIGNCDKDAPARASSASARRADTTPAAPDTSTRGQFLHATKCVTTMGFAAGCNKP